jgi:hypothetical protein
MVNFLSLHTAKHAKIKRFTARRVYSREKKLRFWLDNTLVKPQLKTSEPLGVVVHICKSSTQKTEAREL